MAENKIVIAAGVLDQAKMNNQEALKGIFQQFSGTDEQIKFAEYMGQHGIVIGVTHNFACLTDKRIISLKVGSFGEVLYQDAFIEDLNSGAIYQPSVLGLYILSAIVIIFTLGIGILLIPLIVKWYYKINKCGLVFFIKEGLSVYMFVNRNRMSRSNALWRLVSEVREGRIAKRRM